MCASISAVATQCQRSFDELCKLLRRTNPVVSIAAEGEWTAFRLAPASMPPPTRESVAVAAGRSVDIHLSTGSCKLDAVDILMPSAFYHCTSPETLLDILSEGWFASAGGLGEKPHTPDGLYAFGNRVVSSMSNYAKHGCQLEFQAACFALSIADSKKVKVVPEGVACRLKRSTYEIFGCTGYEWVFHPLSCQIQGFRIKNARAFRFLLAVHRMIAETSNLGVAHTIQCALSFAPAPPALRETLPAQLFYKAGSRVGDQSMCLAWL